MENVHHEYKVDFRRRCDHSLRTFCETRRKEILVEREMTGKMKLCAMTKRGSGNLCFQFSWRAGAQF